MKRKIKQAQTKLTTSASLMLLTLMLMSGLALAQPTITTFAPASGVIGSSVTITGTGFNTAAAQNIVFFGATRAMVTAASTNSLTVTVPLGATYEYLTVTNLADNLTAYSAIPFIVTLAGSLNFEPKVDFATGQSPYSIGIGDLDGDNKPDLAVAYYTGNTISVLRNTSTSGTTSFTTKVDFSTENGPNSVSIGDIDGDGKPDLVVVNTFSNSVSVLRNTSTSGIVSFAPKVDFETDASPRSVGIGDIDGDGKPDLAVSNYWGWNVSVLRNTSVSGTVSFATRVDFATDEGASSISIGDLDGDGKPDLVVANVDYDSQNLSVLLNTSTSGTVTFAAKVELSSGITTKSLCLGDINGDGKLDIAKTQNVGSYDNLSVMRNYSSVGEVYFQHGISVSIGGSLIGVSIGDIDGDGKPDLAVANGSKNIYGGISTSISVSRNNLTSCTTGFAAKADFTTGVNPVEVKICDIDGDGKPDLVAPNAGSNTVSVIRQGPQGQNCILPTVPTLSASSTINCGQVNTTLNIASGTLNDATTWQWYSGSCGGTPVGTGTSVIVSPAVTTTYFARGEGGCVASGCCAAITITLISSPVGLATNHITASSATAKWDTVDCAVGYKFQYRIPKVTEWTTLHHNLDYPSKKLRRLLPSTNYQWRVQSKFADGTYSANSATASFTTLALRSGLEMIDNTNDLFVYPNPAADQLTLEFPFTEGVSTKITVVNTIGQTVLEQNSIDDSNTIQLNIQSLTKGLYVVTVINGDNSFTARFIKE